MNNELDEKLLNKLYLLGVEIRISPRQGFSGVKFTKYADDYDTSTIPRETTIGFTLPDSDHEDFNPKLNAAMARAIDEFTDE